MPLQNFGVVPDAVDRPVVPRIVRAAQPDAMGFAHLARLIGPFYSYRLSPSSDGMTFDQEQSIVGILGGIVVHDPRLGSGMDPDASAIEAAAHDVNALYSKGNNVLVHCLHGRERTGAVCAAWRLIYGGASLADVEADLKAYGVTGLTAIVDHEILEAVREIARRQGK